MKHGRPDYQGRIVDLEEKIPENEPVFLIRAQDMQSGPALRAYAKLVQADAGGVTPLVEQIQAFAKEMDIWPNKKQPTAPAPEPAPAPAPIETETPEVDEDGEDTL